MTENDKPEPVSEAAPTEPFPTDNAGFAQTAPVDAAAAAPRRAWYRRKSTLVATSSAAALALVAGAGAGGYAMGLTQSPATSASEGDVPENWYDLPDDADPFSPREGLHDNSAGTTEEETDPATAEQTAGVVTITTDLYYGSGAGAGTGVILDADGTILTNTHVIAGSTEIEVTVESTGEVFEAEVVGTSASNDIALIQLVGASGLDAVTLNRTNDVMIGDAVTSVGNADGTGDLVAAEGTVTDLDSNITVRSSTGEARRLAGLIEIEAYVVPGNSGGPLFDDQGEVVGIITAASTGGRQLAGFAVPIVDAISIAREIALGNESDTIRIGLPAFLGVQLPPASPETGSGVAITGTTPGGPAAEAGLVAGDVIIAVDDAAVAGSESLRSLISAFEPGDRVTLTYVDASGDTHDVAVTLVGGPAA